MDDENQSQSQLVTGIIVLVLSACFVLFSAFVGWALYILCCKKNRFPLAPKGKTPNSSSKTSTLKRLDRSWKYLKRWYHSADDGGGDHEKNVAPDVGSAKNSEDQTRISNCSRDFCDVRSRPETTASAVTPGSVYQVPKLRFDYNLPTSPRDQSKNDLGMDGVWTPDASPSCSLLLSDGEVLEGEPNREHLCNDVIAPQAQSSHITCASHRSNLIDAEEDQAQSTVDGDLDMAPLLSRTGFSGDITTPTSHSDPASNSNSEVYDSKGDGDVSSESLLIVLPPCQNFDDTPTTTDFTEHDDQQGIDHSEHDESELESEKEAPKCLQNLDLTQSDRSAGSSHLLPPSDRRVLSLRSGDLPVSLFSNRKKLLDHIKESSRSEPCNLDRTNSLTAVAPSISKPKDLHSPHKQIEFPLNGSDDSSLSFRTASVPSFYSTNSSNDSGVTESLEAEAEELSPEEQDSCAEGSEESS